MADMPSQVAGTEDDVFTFTSEASKEFPLAPEGVHNVMVQRALFTMRDNTFAPEKGKQPTVSMLLQSDQKYKEEQSGAEKSYNLFKTMKISDHPKSSMFEFFNSVLGIAVPLNEKKQIVMKRKEQKRDDGTSHMHLPQFEALRFSVIVKHEKKEDGKMRDRVDSVFASPEQKKANADIFRAQA